MATEHKKYNSNASFTIHHARITAEPKVISDNFVKLTTVVTSANEKDEDIWVDIVPVDGQAPLAQYIEKGDLVSVEGFLTCQRWGTDNDKVSHTLRNARLMLSPEQIATLKGRGFTPGGGGKSKGKSKPASKPTKAKREIEVPADDEE
jgi:single-stranded DNA-binding protein